MDDNSTLEEKCEHLMNVVVESRKKFGKKCVEYDKKTILLENQIQQLKLNQMKSSNLKTKPCKYLQEFNANDSEDLDMFSKELQCSQLRLEKLRQDVMNTQRVVWQIKNDAAGKALQKPITVEAMMAEAKMKHDE